MELPCGFIGYHSPRTVPHCADRAFELAVLIAASEPRPEELAISIQLTYLRSYGALSRSQAYKGGWRLATTPHMQHAISARTLAHIIEVCHLHPP